MNHIFIIHSSIHGHSGGFHVLARVNIVAGNTGVHVWFFSNTFPGVGLMDHVVVVESCSLCPPGSSVLRYPLEFVQIHVH